MKIEKLNLEKTTVTEEERLDRESQRAFNSVSVSGIVLGALAVYAGATMGWDEMKGLGYGVLAMDAFMNVVTRGIRYLQFRGE